LPNHNRLLTEILRIPASARREPHLQRAQGKRLCANEAFANPEIFQYPEGGFVGAAAAVLPQSTQ
jgi:hypothetical protein